jgi:hypothetical protein
MYYGASVYVYHSRRGYADALASPQLSLVGKNLLYSPGQLRYQL